MITKQEKIRVGVGNIIAEHIETYGDLNIEKVTKEITAYLHSQGVVLKVERELPLAYEPLDIPCEVKIKNYRRSIKRAGYGAFEPLIKEV